jgi:lipopolysaccharide export system protein LptA
MNMRLFLIVLVVVGHFVSVASQSNSKKRLVQLKHSDIWNEDMVNRPGIRDLSGNIWFVDGDVSMYCDRAVQFTQKNAFDAFGKVRIVKGDSIYIYSDELYYDGETKLAKLRKNVRLENRNTKLTITTQKLDYNLNNDVGYYFDGGEVIDTSYVLNSIFGYYYVATGKVYFKSQVEVTTTNATIKTDTLEYDSNNEIVSILGPTHIYSDTTYIYSENGFHDPRNNTSVLKTNSKIVSGHYIIEGSDLHYDAATGMATSYAFMQLTDTLQKIIIKGKQGEYNESTQKAFVTDSALFIQYSGFDSLFLHADTLRFENDTNNFRVMRAYNNVRFFRFDVQGKCDSMVYSTFDSVIYMFNKPVLWSVFNQMTGDKIDIFNKTGRFEQIDMTGNAFLISRVDSIRFNQIKGRKISGYVWDNQLRKIFVDGNTESLYFLNDGPFIVGINKAESPYLTLFMDSNKVEKVIMSPKPQGKLYSPDNLTIEQSRLENFMWLSNIRPWSPYDVFIKPKPVDFK